MRLSPYWLIFWMCAALVLNQSCFMNLAGVLPEMIDVWSLTGSEAGLLAGAFFLGYVPGVAVLSSLSDRLHPKRIYLWSALVASLGSLGLFTLADGVWEGFLLRVVTGIGFAGCHMPGLKAMTDHLDGSKAAPRAVTYYTAVFALGSGLSILTGGLVGDAFGWRWAFGLSTVGSMLSLTIGWLVLPAHGSGHAAGESIWTSLRKALDYRPVLRNRKVMGYVAHGFGTTFEVFATRAWFVTFLGFLAVRPGAGDIWIVPVLAAFLVSVIGVPVSILVGELALHIDRRRMLLGLSLCSGLLLIVLGAGTVFSYNLVVAVALIYGIASFGRTAATTGGTVASAPPAIRGGALGLQASVGFGAGVIGPPLVGVTVDLMGGLESAAAWSWAFGALTAGPVFGIIALYFLGRPTERESMEANR